MKNFTSICYAIIGIVILNCPLVQGQEKKYNEFLTNGKINASGSAILFFKDSINKTTMVLKDVKHGIEYIIDHVHQSDHVLTNDLFLGIDYKNKFLYKIDLKRNRIDTIKKVARFYWSAALHTVLYTLESSSQLCIWDLKTNKTQHIVGSKYLDLSKDQRKLIYTTLSNEVVYLNLVTKHKLVHKVKPAIALGAKRVLWDRINETAFLISNSGTHFTVFKTDHQSGSLAFEHSLIDANKNSIIDTIFREVKLLDHQRIAVEMKSHSQGHPQNDLAEIWLGSSKGITPVIQENIHRHPQLAIIDLKKNKMTNLFDPNKWMFYKINSNDGTIYAYEGNENDDLTKLYPERSIYSRGKDLSKNKLIGKVNGSNESVISVSFFPHLIYFMGRDWHYYDESLNKHINITKNTDDNFQEKIWEVYLISNDAYYEGVKTFKDRWIVFTGNNGLWYFDTVSKKISRKVNGAKDSKRYKLSLCNFSSGESRFGWGNYYAANEYDDLILTWNSDKHTKSGISILNKDGHIIPLVEDHALIHFNSIQRSEKFVTYVKQRADTPPTLYRYDIDKKKETLIYRSNSWDLEAPNVKSEYIEWKNSHGESRGAIVRFPTNYDKNKRYPAIVDIYQVKFDKQHIYKSPYETEGNGINYRNYLTEGYFVIEPDLYYQIENLGRSAASCLDETLDELIERYSIDADRLGLIGHSFGGYETNFFITQTDRFKVAVSSSGSANLVSQYLTYSLAYQRPDIWRFESQQWRMGKSYFDIPEKYIANSPVQHSKNIKTPLLLISGKQDYVVNWNESVTMFLALKRQNKEVNLLMYPNEGHAIMKPENKKDVADKMKGWLDHYLKQGKKPEWLN